MAVSVVCACGGRYEVASTDTDTVAHCPHCGRRGVVPRGASLVPVAFEEQPGGTKEADTPRDSAWPVAVVETTCRAPLSRHPALWSWGWRLAALLIVGLAAWRVGVAWRQEHVEVPPPSAEQPSVLRTVAKGPPPAAADSKPSTGMPASAPTGPPAGAPAQPKAASVPVESAPPSEPPSATIPAPAPPDPATAPWRVLFTTAPTATRIPPWPLLAGDRPSLLRFRGPGGDPNLVPGFQANGTFRAGGRGQPLVRQGGPHAALDLGHFADFELDCDLAAPGLGGWFVCFGFDGQRGDLLYQVTLKTSSVWYLYEAQGGEFPVRPVGLSDWRFETRGRLHLAVVQGRLSVAVADHVLVQDHPLPRYRPGTLHLGTATTQYGPRPLAIHELRVRER